MFERVCVSGCVRGWYERVGERVCERGCLKGMCVIS